ncbi:hypothetical protein ACS0TY_032376 [Phlomoides rotata]
MAQDVEAMQEKPPNACCAALKDKHTKLLEKCKNLTELKNQFRECTALIQDKYNVIEKEKESLKKALEESNLQVNMWKDEKEKEAGRRIDLEDEVSALQDEVRSMKQNGKSTSEEADKQLQERLVVAEKEIKQLNVLLGQERGRVALEKKKADEALKKVEMGKNKVSEAQKVANAERKKTEENRGLLERLRKETDDLKSMLALEKSKSEAAEKKVDAEKQKAIRESTSADSAMAKSEKQRVISEASLKKATFEKKRADDLNRKLEETKKKAEAAEKKVEAEKQRGIRERKRADMAVAKSEEQRKLAETNLKMAMFEKDRADDLNMKLEEARNRAGKIENEMHKHKCSGKLVEAQALQSNAGRNAELTSNACAGMLKNDTQISQRMEKMLLEKGHNILGEKNCADSEKKKAKKQRKVAEEHKRIAMKQKSRADHLSRELESYKLKFKESQKKLQEFISCRIGSNVPPRYNDVASETDTVKLLEKQLELERLLVKHAMKATKLEAFRNKMLHQELCNLKQECCQFKQRLGILDKNFLLDREGRDQLEKMGDQVSKRKTLCSDGCHSQLTSGTDSRMDPPFGGSNQKMLQSTAIDSTSASFSDLPLVGSQERGTLSVMTPANLREYISNCEPSVGMLSEKMRTRYNEPGVSKADKSMRSPIKDGANKRRVGSCEKKGILDAGESLEKMYSKGPKLHQCLSEKPSTVHGILNSQKDNPKDENLKETSCRELSRPCKKRKTSSEGTVVIHCLQSSVEPESMLDTNTNGPNDSIPASSLGPDLMKSHGHFKDGMNNITGHYNCPQDFDEMVAHDYRKLLDLDNAAEEDSYRRAIAMPLSPTLPTVEFLEADNSEMLVCSSFQEGLSNVRDNPTSVSRVHIIESEKNQTNLSSMELVPSLLQTEEGPMDFSKDLDPMSRGDTHLDQIHASGGKLGMSDLSGSGNKEISLLSENVIESPDGGLLNYFVVASDNKESSSILRILQTIGSCMPHRSFIHSAEPFLRTIRHNLLKAEALSIKEKACVFFSLILRETSAVELDSPTNVLSDNSVQILGSVTMHINSVFSDPLFRRTFMESCDLFELLAVIEDFLLHRKVLVCGEVSADSDILSTSKLNLILNGNEIMLSEVVASAHLLIAGASLLASLCLAIDHIGFVCEVSCNIIRMQKFDPSVMLAILHAFAHICGVRYLTLQQYSLAMTVVKSLVIFFEKQTSATNSTSLIPAEVENPSKIWLCTSCLFSDGSVPMEDVAVLLLENLQKQCYSESCSQDSLALNNLIASRVRFHEDGIEEGSGMREAVPLSSKSDENMCDFIDILSLVEVLASFMSWNWTSDHLIRQICEYLESRLMEGSSTAIIVLLGQLGRLGVDAGGYDDSGVEKLRGWLSAFVCESSFTKFSHSVQFAIMTSLFSLTPIKLEDIIDGGTSHSLPTSVIREWFSSLTDEQRSFLRIHQTTGQKC